MPGFLEIGRKALARVFTWTQTRQFASVVRIVVSFVLAIVARSPL